MSKRSSAQRLAARAQQRLFLFFPYPFQNRIETNKPNRTNRKQTEFPFASRNAPTTTHRDSDIWAIYSRLCIHDTLDHIENATQVEDPDIESLNPGYAQPAYR